MSKMFIWLFKSIKNSFLITIHWSFVFSGYKCMEKLWRLTLFAFLSIILLTIIWHWTHGTVPLKHINRQMHHLLKFQVQINHWFLKPSTWIFVVNVSFYELYIKRCQMFAKQKGLVVFKVRLAMFRIWFCCLF